MAGSATFRSTSFEQLRVPDFHQTWRGNVAPKYAIRQLPITVAFGAVPVSVPGVPVRSAKAEIVIQENADSEPRAVGYSSKGGAVGGGCIG